MDRRESNDDKLRRFQRIDLYLHAHYQITLPEQGKTIAPFETENISIGGLMFYSYERIDPGTHLEITLNFNKLPLKFSAKVAWINEWLNPDNLKQVFAIGLEYTSISHELVSQINEITSKVVLIHLSNEKT